jgi:acrylyl-CoA reductase (NADPH)
MFSALVVEESDDGVRAEVRDADDEELPEGDVTIDVEFSGVNYKDALAIVDGRPVVRAFPLVPGIDLAGTVASSASPHWRPGDAVLLCGWGLGEERWGGLAERARVDGAWLTALPDGWTARDAMAAGTAGFSASLAAGILEPSVPRPGPVLVTGASGGVGSFAVMLLSAAGYDVVAATTTPDASAYLRDLGAVELVDTREIGADVRALGAQRWAGAVDNVGGDVLAGVISCTGAGGVVASVGNAGGMDLHTTVAPFILRGVSLAGVNSVRVPAPSRADAWQRLADRIPRARLRDVTERVGLDGAVDAAARVLSNRVTGRVVVDVRA